jgi:N-methylhydantoinase A
METSGSMTQATDLGVDIGGAFTDVVLLKGEQVFVEKTLTTHDDLLRGFFAGVHSVLRRAGLRTKDVSGTLVHATTVVTNALIERRQSRIGMVFTRGFADILEIRTGTRESGHHHELRRARPDGNRHGCGDAADKT